MNCSEEEAKRGVILLLAVRKTVLFVSGMMQLPDYRSTKN